MSVNKPHVSSRRPADWDARALPLRCASVADDPFLFYGLTSSSFLEITASVYTRNLTEYYADDAELHAWLRDTWEPEELAHGAAMRACVERVWPEYDWSTAYASFYEEYSALCGMDQLHGSPARELLARCVTETQTAASYRMLSRYTCEPALADLLERMYRDEVRHYGQFLRHFRRYDRAERLGAVRIVQTLLERTSEVADADLGTTLKHVELGWHGRPTVPVWSPREFASAFSLVACDHCDFGLARRMLLQPLGWRADSRSARGLEDLVRRRIEAMA